MSIGTLILCRMWLADWQSWRRSGPGTHNPRQLPFAQRVTAVLIIELSLTTSCPPSLVHQTTTYIDDFFTFSLTENNYVAVLRFIFFFPSPISRCNHRTVKRYTVEKCPRDRFFEKYTVINWHRSSRLWKLFDASTVNFLSIQLRSPWVICGEKFAYVIDKRWKKKSITLIICRTSSFREKEHPHDVWARHAHIHTSTL